MVYRPPAPSCEVRPPCLLFPPGIWKNTLLEVDPDSEERIGKGKSVEEIMRFVAGMIKQTEEDLAFQRRSERDHGWLRFLEGKLQAFKLVQGYLEDLQRKREQLH